jgi:hypothetical protein
MRRETTSTPSGRTFFEESFAAGAVGHYGVNQGQLLETASEFATVFGGEFAISGRGRSFDAE